MAADDGEEDEARIDQIAGQLGQQQAQKFHADLGVELAFAFEARAEDIGLLGDAQALAGGGDVEQNLEAHRATAAARSASNASRRIMKKPLIGSLRVVPTSRWVSLVASAGDRAAPLAKDSALPPST